MTNDYTEPHSSNLLYLESGQIPDTLISGPVDEEKWFQDSLFPIHNGTVIISFSGVADSMKV